MTLNKIIELREKLAEALFLKRKSVALTLLKENASSLLIYLFYSFIYLFIFYFLFKFA